MGKIPLNFFQRFREGTLYRGYSFKSEQFLSLFFRIAIISRQTRERRDRTCYFFGYDIKSRWIIGELKKFVNRFLFFSLSLRFKNTRNNEESYLSDESIIPERKINYFVFVRCASMLREELDFNFKFLVSCNANNRKFIEDNYYRFGGNFII